MSHTHAHTASLGLPTKKNNTQTCIVYYIKQHQCSHSRSAMYHHVENPSDITVWPRIPRESGKSLFHAPSEKRLNQIANKFNMWYHMHFLTKTYDANVEIIFLAFDRHSN